MKIEIDNDKIKQMIYGNNLNVESLVNKSDLSKTHIYRILNGEQIIIRERTLFSLARVLKCNPKSLTFSNGNKGTDGKIFSKNNFPY